MLGYRIIINNNPKGDLTWECLFEKENSEYGDTDVDRIFSVAREFVKTLAALQINRKENQS